MKRIIYLIRHGQPVPKDSQKRCISQTELLLSEGGQKQAEKAGNFLLDKEISCLFTSPRARCVKTAMIIGAF